MKNVLLPVALVLVLGVSLVPVSAWADSEPASSTAVETPDVGYDSVVDAPFVPVPESGSESSADSAAATDPAEPTLEDVMQEAEQLLAEDGENATDPVYTIWDKPFTEYTPTEGYLFLLFVLVLAYSAFNLFKGGIW